MAAHGEMTALEVADRFAAEINGIPYEMIEDLRQPTFVEDFEPIHHEDLIAPLILARSGHEGDIIKGGNRWWEYPTVEAGRASVGSLNYGMDVKNTYINVVDHTTGKPIRGAKLWGGASLAGRSPEFKATIAAQVVDRLGDTMGAFGYVPAADAGTNAQYCDAMSKRYIETHPDDKYALAAVTGKTPDRGGLPPRPGATGNGGYAAQVTHLDRLLEDGVVQDRPQMASLQGGGNVAAHHAYAASHDPKDRVRVQNIGEQEGVLYTDDPTGIIFTGEMITRVADNPSFSGSKLRAYHDLIKISQPGLDLRFSGNPEDIYTRPADVFISAAVGTLVIASRVKTMREAGIIALEEEGNTATSQDGQDAADALGLHINPDIVVNPGGVWMSLKEREVNIAMANGTMAAPPSNEVLNTELNDFMTHATTHTLEVARQYGVSPRVAACIISQRNLLRHAGVALAA